MASRTTAKVLEKIIVVATDRTLEKKLQLEVRHQQDRILAVGKILGSRGDFIDFLRSVRELVQAPPAGPGELIRLLHTQKGHAHLLSLTEVAEFAHRLEELAKGGEAREKILPLLPEYLAVLESFLKENEEILGSFSSTAAEEVPRAVPRAQATELVRTVVQALGPKSPASKALLQTLYWNQPTDALIHYRDTAQTIAERQGKEVVTTVSCPGDLFVHLDPYRPFFSSCVHLFRNAVDHGIEPKLEREKKGKPPVGRIDCQISRSADGSRLLIELADDGEGVDRARVKVVAVQSQILSESEAERLSDDETLRLLFRAGFSTRAEVTELSGRGAGLDAVKVEVERLGGTVAIESIHGQGTRIRFDLPFLDGLAQL